MVPGSPVQDEDSRFLEVREGGAYFGRESSVEKWSELVGTAHKLCLPNNFSIKYWPWIKREGTLLWWQPFTSHWWLPNKVKQKKSQKCACLGLQMLSCISVLNRSLPSGVHLSRQRRRRACYVNWPVVFLGFFGQIIGYNWRLQNYLMLFSDFLNRTEANNKTSESWPCCLSEGHRQDTCPSCTPQRIRAAH